MADVTAIVFLGPTLSVSEARDVLDAVYLPPAQCGDVYRACKDRPTAIGIVDGYFERVPAVWHKEILWAMTQGVHVYGAASMGALRAAELAPFGMHGVGVVYEAYRSGALEDDDEVAVVHGSPETGYIALSDALVNIRWTLAAAEREAVISAPSRTVLEQVAKQLFYPERCYALLLRHARAAGVAPAELETFASWLERGRLDPKRQDAILMLQSLRELLDARSPPMAVDFEFETTSFWRALVAECAGGDRPGGG